MGLACQPRRHVAASSARNGKAYCADTRVFRGRRKFSASSLECTLIGWCVLESTLGASIGPLSDRLSEYQPRRAVLPSGRLGSGGWSPWSIPTTRRPLDTVPSGVNHHRADSRSLAPFLLRLCGIMPGLFAQSQLIGKETKMGWNDHTDDDGYSNFLREVVKFWATRSGRQGHNPLSH